MKLVIFGCGNIANRIAESCALVDNIELVGFASKDGEKAKAYAERYGCARSGDYDHFLDSDIDAVYVATYNPSHYELIKKCLENRKHVICEKPMLSKSEEVEELFALAEAQGVILMEALKSVFLPAMVRLRQMIIHEEFGKLEKVYASFMRDSHWPKDHWINILGTGGALKDLGTYAIGTLNYLLGTAPEVVEIKSDAGYDKADTTAIGELDYDGTMARFAVSNAVNGDNCLIIKGTKGVIRVEDYWKTGKAKIKMRGQYAEWDEECISDFYYELKHFADLVDNGAGMSPVMSKEASLAILKVTDHSVR